jgi:hypothetical protein
MWVVRLIVVWMTSCSPPPVILPPYSIRRPAFSRGVQEVRLFFETFWSAFCRIQSDRAQHLKRRRDVHRRRVALLTVALASERKDAPRGSAKSQQAQGRTCPYARQRPTEIVPGAFIAKPLGVGLTHRHPANGRASVSAPLTPPRPTRAPTYTSVAPVMSPPVAAMVKPSGSMIS